MLNRNPFLPIVRNKPPELVTEAHIAETVGSRFPDSPGWTYPRPEISESDGHYEIRLYAPGLEIKSVVVETSEDFMVLSGLRWVKPSAETPQRLAPFRRLIDLPNGAAGKRWEVSYRDDILILEPPSLDRVTTGT